MPRAKKTIIPVEKKHDGFLIRIFVSGQVHEASAETIAEALKLLHIHSYKTKCVIQVEHDGVMKEVRLMPRIVRKMVMPMNQQFFEKRLQILLR